MVHLSTRARPRLSVASTLLAVCAALAVVGSPVAQAATGPAAPAAGPVRSYVVNAAGTGARDLQKVERAITRAGGVLVQSWPEIGVSVVQSTNTTFKGALSKAAGRLVVSVGETRNTAVSVAAGAGSPSLSGTVVPDPNEVAQWGNTLIKAPAAHEITDGDSAVTVGILDSGVAQTSEFSGKLDEQRSVDCSAAGGRPVVGSGAWIDSFGHGTSVASVAAARRDGFGMVGVAPAVRVASLKVGDDSGHIYPEYAICAAMWAGRTSLPVANMSFTLDPWIIYCDSDPDQSAVKLALSRAVSWAQGRGVIFVAAAGNDGFDLAVKGTYDLSPTYAPVRRQLDPACKQLPTELPEVVVVGGVEQGADGSPQMYAHANRGLGVIDVTAPAANILAATQTGGYGYAYGTSFAAPHASGVLALMKSTHAAATTTDLLARLTAEADPLTCPSPEASSGSLCVGTDADNSYFGHGVVDALDAVSVP